MAESKGISIPKWQQKEAAKSPDTATEALPEATSPESSKLTSRATLLEEATKFLESEGVKGSSTERKVKFLESKGLTNEEIEALLGVAPSREASNTVCILQDVNPLVS